MSNEIRASKNGPYLITGPALLVDADGNETQVERKMVALCRCGASQSKPLCDGKHVGAGFEAAQVTVQLSEG